MLITYNDILLQNARMGCKHGKVDPKSAMIY